MKRKWTYIFAALLLLAAAAYIISQVGLGEEVEVKRVEPTDIARTLTEEGVVVPLQERAVHSLYTARLAELKVKEGERVSAGALLAVLDETELKFKLQELEAQLSRLDAEKLGLEETPTAAELDTYRLSIEEGEKALARAQQHYDRMLQLFEEGVIAKTELEEAEELLSSAEYNLMQQEKALQALEESYRPPRGSREVIEAQKKALLAQKDFIKYQMENYQLMAPITGIVAEIGAAEGGLVSPQVPLFKLFKEDDYQLETRVLTSDTYYLFDGMPVKLLLEYKNEDLVFSGQITKILPFAERDYSPLGLEEERVQVNVAFELPEDVDVAPGYKLDVEFTTAELTAALVVPKTALFSHHGQDALLVVENDRAVVRTVTTGLETRQEIVITEGISEGALVIINPQGSGIREGDRVTYTTAGSEGD